MYSAVSSLSSGFVPPNFLIPDQLAAIVEDLTIEEIRRGTKLTPAIQVGFEATYYEIQIVLEVTVLDEGLSIVLVLPMNSKSSTCDVCRAILCATINRSCRANPTRLARQLRFIVSLMSSWPSLLITHSVLNGVLPPSVNVLEQIELNYAVFPAQRMRLFFV